jgi:GntR family transcriptional regulator
MDTSLPRTSGTSLHRQVFLVLRHRILEGQYAAGDALPKEMDLVGEFGVGRITVRRALADLELEGLVLRRHGRGTFVRSHREPIPRVPTLGYIDEMKYAAQTTQVQVLTVETRVPPPNIGTVLDLQPSERAVHAVRLRGSNGIPLALTDAWVPEHIGRGITAASLKKRALYELLMDQGVKFGRVLQQISAEPADPAKATLLNCEVSSPLIRLTRLLHDGSGQPVQHLTVHLSPQRSSIVMDIDGDAIDTLGGGHVVHDMGSLQTGGPRSQGR